MACIFLLNSSEEPFRNFQGVYSPPENSETFSSSLSILLFLRGKFPLFLVAGGACSGCGGGVSCDAGGAGAGKGIGRRGV